MKIENNSINQFIDELVQQKGLTNLDKDVLEQIKEDLSNRLEDRINAAILSKISANKLDEFNKLLDLNDEEKTQNFVKENIPNLEELITIELVNFGKLYIS